MQVTQIYTIMNSISSEILGKTDLVQEDLSGIVDMGDEIFNAGKVDNYVKSLVDHIGRVVFVDRPYMGSVPSVLMDGWEFGSVLEKIRVDLPSAAENESWELTDGTSYDQDVFTKPVVTAKFFNSKVTFEVPMSFTEMQVKESFSNATQLNGFMSMLYNAVDKSMTIKLDALVMRTINNMIGQTLYSEYEEAKYGDSTGIRAVNLLYMYNQANGTTLTAEKAIYTPEFIRFASYQIGLYSDRLTKISTLFNAGGTDRFTPKDMQHIVLLSDFVNAASSYLQSDTFHDQLVSLPKAETVPYWQGSGKKYSFDDISGIDIKISDGSSPAVAITATGILGVIFDRDALGVTNMNRRVTSHYNAKAEFYNNWYKMDAGYFNDMNENFVVFFVADPTPAPTPGG